MMLQIVSERMNYNVHTLLDLAHLGVEAILFHGHAVLYAEQNKAKQNKTKQNKTKQNKTCKPAQSSAQRFRS